MAKHGGRIVKTTGDGVLLEFPSVVDAVECAVAVQAVMARGTKASRRTGVCCFGSGSTSATSLSRAMTFLEMASTSRLGLRASLNRVASASHLRLTNRFAARSQSSSPILASRTSRISPVRSVPMRLARARTPIKLAPLPSSAPRLSIVVLPFANIGGDPEQDYFVDGVTESLTTDLSRISGSFVIARNTAFTFKGKAVDVKQIGRELERPLCA